MRTLIDIKNLQIAKGLHFFDPESLAYFQTTICTELIHDNYFITLEQFNGANDYVVRSCNWETGEVSDVLDKTFASLAEASNAISTLARHEKNCSRAKKSCGSICL